MRTYLTKLIWFEDRLSSIGSGWLAALTLLCVTSLAALIGGLIGFLEDLAYLATENDFGMALISLGFVLMTGAALWVLSCCVGALSRRLLLYFRGL